MTEVVGADRGVSESCFGTRAYATLVEFIRDLTIALTISESLTDVFMSFERCLPYINLAAPLKRVSSVPSTVRSHVNDDVKYDQHYSDAPDEKRCRIAVERSRKVEIPK